MRVYFCVDTTPKKAIVVVLVQESDIIEQIGVSLQLIYTFRINDDAVTGLDSTALALNYIEDQIYTTRVTRSNTLYSRNVCIRRM